MDWTGAFAATRELDVHYVRDGSGSPIIFLHGWPEFNRTWKHNLPALAKEFDCIAPDLRGFGKTRRKVASPASGVTPQLLAKDLGEFADALGIDRFAIVSHDVGAFVAQTFARAHPDRVSALFFFNCPHPGVGKRWGDATLFPESWYQMFHQKDFAAELVGSSREACEIYLRHFLTHWCYQKDAFAEELDAWVDNFMSNDNLQGGFDWYRGVSRLRARLMRDGPPPMPKITAPTQVFWGARDPVLKVDWLDNIGDFFSDIDVRVAENSGHFVHFEEPELANEEMLKFFRRVL